VSLETVGTALIRRHIGRRLADLRDKARLTQEQAAQKLEKGRSTIIRIEDGADNVRLRDIDMRAMLDLYKAGDQERTVILALAAETRDGRTKSWWHDYTNTELPEWFGLFVVLEDSARTIREYESEIVPGLLQTREYAELLYRTPGGSATAEQISQRVQVRMERQSVLTRSDPPKYEVVLNEAVIRRPVGERELMVGQLTHLLDMGKRPNISIRILPWSAGMHGGMAAGNSFMLLDFPEDPSGEPIEPSLAYVDTLTGAMYLNKPDEFAAYEDVWRDVKKKALSVADSKNLITSALEGLEQ
jgi:transcriptional regulator with XRE-family HTH domain